MTRPDRRRRRGRAAATVLVALAAACGSSSPPSLDRLTLPAGYHVAPMAPGEPDAFRRQYEADAGATDVALHRVEAPTGGPTLVVVALAWASSKEADLAPIADRLARDVPIGGSRPATVDGHPAREHVADETYQSSVLAVNGRRGVLVYGSTIAGARALAAAALRSW